MRLAAAACSMAGLTAGRARNPAAKRSPGCSATRRPDPMLAAAQGFWQLPGDELDQLLTLSREADRVGLKLTVRESAITRCRPDAALRVAAQMAAVLRAHGVDLTGPQQTKTRATLDFFSARPASGTRDARSGRESVTGPSLLLTAGSKTLPCTRFARKNRTNDTGAGARQAASVYGRTEPD
jgi:hypothetical protein